MATIQEKSAGEDAEKLEPLCTAWWECKWSSHYENNMAVFQNFRPELPCNPAIPLLGLYPKELKMRLEQIYCTPVFRAVLFTIAQE